MDVLLCANCVSRFARLRNGAEKRRNAGRSLFSVDGPHVTAYDEKPLRRSVQRFLDMEPGSDVQSMVWELLKFNASVGLTCVEAV